MQINLVRRNLFTRFRWVCTSCE